MDCTANHLEVPAKNYHPLRHSIDIKLEKTNPSPKRCQAYE